MPNSVRIRIPTPLRGYVGDQSAVTVEADTAGEALAALTAHHEALRSHLYTDDGALRSFVNVYRNEDDIRYLDGPNTPLADDDTLSIVPSIAGGSDAAVTDPTADLPDLTNDERQRYARHLILPDVGPEGQRKLKASSVLLVGAGGLGSPLALYLAAAGVGRIGLVDFDVVDASNLQRQLLHGTKDVGRPKLESARDRIHDVNPHVQVDLHPVRLTSENALGIIEQYDVVADGTDNFPTRYLVNDACILTGTPNVYGSIFRFEGQVSVFCTPEGPSYRCLYEEPPPPGLVPSCAEGGVLGVLPGLVGTIQATETIKLLLGIGEPLIGRLLLIDTLAMDFRTLRVRRNPDWVVGAPHPTVTELVDYEAFCGLPTPTSNGASSMSESDIPEITVTELKAQIDRDERPFLLDVRKPNEVEIASIGGTLIPVGELEDRIDELEAHRDEDFVVYCRSGARSAKAVQILREHGFTGPVNLKGGVLAWSDEIDPSMPKY
jgi:adenylyltransferase/sulfurtransferase